MGLLRAKSGAFELAGARKWASLWVGLHCLFAAVPAQGRAAGVMSGIAFLGAATTFARFAASMRALTLKCRSPFLLHPLPGRTTTHGCQRGA